MPFEIEDSELSDEGFGPGTDLISSVVAILIVIVAVLRFSAPGPIKDPKPSVILEPPYRPLALQIPQMGPAFSDDGRIQRGNVVIPQLLENKGKFTAAIETVCGSKLSPILEGAEGRHYAIRTDKCNFDIVDFVNYSTIAFGDGVLFDKNKYAVSQTGQSVLRTVRYALVSAQEYIMEVQILGNTDTTGTAPANLVLGANRALAVYQELVTNDGLDPENILVSATTYGEHRPVGRDPREHFSAFDLEAANANEDLRKQNRRIEINVFFRVSPK